MNRAITTAIILMVISLWANYESAMEAIHELGIIRFVAACASACFGIIGITMLGIMTAAMYSYLKRRRAS